MTVTLSVSVLLAFSRWACDSRYQNVSILDFIGAKGDGGVGDNWSYKTCKVPAKSSPPTNQHPVFYRPDALPVAQPTVSEHRKNIYDRHCLCITEFCLWEDCEINITVYLNAVVSIPMSVTPLFKSSDILTKIGLTLMHWSNFG